MASPSHASLLGIPRELRLHVYEFLLDSDLSQPSKEAWGFVKRSKNERIGSRLVALSPHQMQRTNPKLNIAWIALLRTCKCISGEVVALQRKRHVARYHEDRNMTYVLDLHAGRCHGFALDSLSWKRIPCPPQQATRLLANIHATRRIMVRGNGGPSPLGLRLFEVLNLLVHCGPMLDVEKPLAMPMRLEELLVELSFEEDQDEHAMEFDHFFHWVREVARTGFLVGIVERVRCRCEGWGKEEVYGVCEGQGVYSRNEWEEYGFRWGVREA